MIFDELTKEFLDAVFLKEPPFKPIVELSQGEMATMLYLVLEKDYEPVGSILKRLSLTSGRMANVLKSLELKGFITKMKSRDDKRVFIVSSTKKGKDFVYEQHKNIFDHTKNIFKFLGVDDAKNYIRITKRLNDEFDSNKKY